MADSEEPVGRFVSWENNSVVAVGNHGGLGGTGGDSEGEAFSVEVEVEVEGGWTWREEGSMELIEERRRG